MKHIKLFEQFLQEGKVIKQKFSVEHEAGEEVLDWLLDNIEDPFGDEDEDDVEYELDQLRQSDPDEVVYWISQKAKEQIDFKEGKGWIEVKIYK